jgi:hypothetical protein
MDGRKQYVGILCIRIPHIEPQTKSFRNMFKRHLYFLEKLSSFLLQVEFCASVDDSQL